MSASPLQQLSSSQSSPEVPINENNETLGFTRVYGKRHAATSGLTWGYYGGMWGGFAIDDGTFALDASDTTYITVDKSDGTITADVDDTDWLDTDNFARVYAITTNTAAVTLVEDYRAGPGGVHGGGAAGVGSNVKVIQLACSDEATALTAGAAKITFRMPYAMTLTAVRASLSTAQATDGGGGIFTVDINEGGTTILSTKLTIDNTERTSTTAAAAAVISDASLADDAEITIDIDQVGDGTAKGLKVTLLGT